MSDYVTVHFDELGFRILGPEEQNRERLARALRFSIEEAVYWLAVVDAVETSTWTANPRAIVMRDTKSIARMTRVHLRSARVWAKEPSYSDALYKHLVCAALLRAARHAIAREAAGVR